MIVAQQSNLYNVSGENDLNANCAKGNAFFQPKLSLNQANDPGQEADNNTEVTTPTENYIRSLNDTGKSLSRNEKQFFEPRFGCDLSNVRLHTGAEAASSAAGINALAYTHGEHIVFGSNQYKPGTKTGNWFMAHELTHVLQQKQSPAGDHIARATPGTASSSFKKENPVGEKFEETFAMKELVEEPAIMGQEFNADCATHRLTFKFPKAFKAVIPGSVPGYDYKGVYVNIEAHYANKTESGTCGTLKLLQVLRYFKMNDEGVPVTKEPTSDINKTRAGMGTGQPSEGWFVDTGEANPDPFYASSGWGTEGKEGSENTPAALWDIPASLPSKSHGKEFFTCAVCENEFDKTRSFAGCIQWGYFIDNDLTVQFYPAAPVASCTGSGRSNRCFEKMGPAGRR